jgi:arylsulfatase A-like enzyme
MNPYLAAAEGDRPNILVLLTDDQVYNSTGYSGNEQVKTPHLDRLAADGLIFDAAYDNTSICMPSRASIMTGMYEYKTGCNFGRGYLLKEKWRGSYPILLREAGYFTGFAGKFGFAVKGPGDKAGYHTNEDLPMDSFDWWKGWPGQGSYKTAENEFFTEYAAEYPHVTRALGAAAGDFFKEAKRRGEPFCFSLSFKAPHGPKSPDKFFDHVYADTVWAEPPNYDEKGAAHLPEQAKSGRQFLQIKDFRPESFQSTMRKYHQQIHGVDYAIGMIRDALDKHGLADNTVIIFLTDNGYNCGSHGFGGKVLPYEEGSRSPMIIFDPRHAVSGQGKRTKALAGSIDIAPTVLDLAGLPVPENMDGHSLMALLDEPEGRVREAMLLINTWGAAPHHSLAVVTETHKYIHWPFAHEMTAKAELYNLTDDRYEMNNQVFQSGDSEVLKQMRRHYDEALATWREECVETGGYPLMATIFDRHLPWDTKVAAMDEKTKRLYLEWRDKGKDKNKDKASTGKE